MTETKGFKQTLDGFHEYLFGVLKLYQDAVPVLKEELKSIEQDHIDALNTSLKSQQALLLQAKSFDKTVANYLQKLNMPAKNLTEMIGQLPEGEQLRFASLLGQFEQTITEVSFYKEKCRVLLQSKLYTIDKALSRQQTQKDNTTYNQDAAEIHGTLFPKSFETTI